MSKPSYKQTLSVLFRITKEIGESRARREALRSVARHTAELLSADSCSVMLLSNSRLTSWATYGLTEDEERDIAFEPGKGVAGWVVSNRASALIEDAGADARFLPAPNQELAIVSLLCVPLVLEGVVTGTVTLTSARKAAFDRHDQEILEFLGNSIALDLDNARLYRLATTDSLTGAYNRQFLMHRLPEEIDRARRYRDSLSLLLMDVDEFKQINDSYGHPVGDEVLQQLVRRMRPSLRDVDLLVRYGGEEFIVVLPKAGVSESRTIAERLRQSVASTPVMFDERAVRVTISVGCATWHSGYGDDMTFINAADEALYRAKRGGRNCVMLAPLPS